MYIKNIYIYDSLNLYSYKKIESTNYKKNEIHTELCYTQPGKVQYCLSLQLLYNLKYIFIMLVILRHGVIYKFNYLGFHLHKDL